MKDVEFSSIVGKTFTSVKSVDGDEVHFSGDDGDYKLYHAPDCCESVDIEDITGELSDLEGSPILQAEESSNSEDNTKDDESFTWTFYRLATIKGSVTIRFYGSSNGYYSESVDFVRL